MEWLHVIVALCLGVSLSAASGFRVFVPLLAVSLGVRFGGLEVNDTLAWAGSDMALIGLSVATVLEIVTCYVPALDHILVDVSAMVLAPVAGALLTAGVLPEMSEFVKWSLAIVAGAGVAGTVQMGTTAVRGTSTATTAGTGNFIVATAENGASLVGSVMAVVVSPVAAAIGLVLLLGVLFWLVRKWLRARKRKKMMAAA